MLPDLPCFVISSKLQIHVCNRHFNIFVESELTLELTLKQNLTLSMPAEEFLEENI